MFATPCAPMRCSPNAAARTVRTTSARATPSPFPSCTVVRALATRGHDVVMFARSATRAPALDRTRAIDGDVRDRAGLDRAARGCDAICHTAALVSIWRRRRQDFDDVNVGGLQNTIDVA